MTSSCSCNNCGKTSLVRDDVTGELICSLCGVVQEYDQFEAHIGGINGPQGTFIRVGTAECEVDRMRKQGIFLIQCAMKWFLSTGRKPLPLAVAVLVLVAELNQVEIGISELAKEVHAVVSTTKTRYKELLEKLVEVAQVLPWGRDITQKNIVKHAPSEIKYLETKAMLKPLGKRKGLDRPEFNLADMVSECSRRLDEHGRKTDSINLPIDSHSIRDAINLLYSPECLSMLYKKSSDRVDLREDCSEWWNGKSELSKKLLLKHLLEKDVGFETVPPSFISN